MTERTTFVDGIGPVVFSDAGIMVNKPHDHFFIERDGRTDDQLINAALDAIEETENK